MLGWLGILKKKLVPEPKPEHSQGLVDLTDWEREYISRSGRCPDCTTGNLLEGPQGGAAMNVLCNFCGAEFNIAAVAGEVWFGERIVQAKPVSSHPLPAA